MKDITCLLTRVLLRIALMFLWLAPPVSLAAPAEVDLDALHASLSDDSSVYRLQNYSFSPTTYANVRVEEGFLVKDTEMYEAWESVGGEGKFHASSNQDPSTNNSVLIASSIRLTGKNGGEFRFCQLNVAAETTMKKQVVVELMYLNTELRLINNVYTMAKGWSSQKLNLAQGGNFIELNLSSKNVFEVLIHAVSTEGIPVMMVIDQIVLDLNNRSCS